MAICTVNESPPGIPTFRAFGTWCRDDARARVRAWGLEPLRTLGRTSLCPGVRPGNGQPAHSGAKARAEFEGNLTGVTHKR